MDADSLFFQLRLHGSGLGFTIFHKRNTMTHNNYLICNNKINDMCHDCTCESLSSNKFMFMLTKS